jgi:hypothetical protein
MIPIFQTRYAVETFGNCFEACLASILELPLRSIPDRLDYIDADAWADLVQRTRAAGDDVGELDQPVPEAYDRDLAAWLEARGLGLLELEVGCKMMTEETWLELARNAHRGYWVGVYRTEAEAAHAVVGFRELIVHNPTRHSTTERRALGELRSVWLLTAANPAKIARRLGPELLPDVEGALEQVGRDIAEHRPETLESARAKLESETLSKVDSIG